MKLPFGLILCKKAFHKNKHRKRVTACYIEAGKIIVGSNSNKTHPLAHLHRGNRIHAELDVLRHIENGSKGTLYIFREKMDGSLGLALPCRECQILLRNKNIRRIVYTTDTGYISEKFL